MNRDFFTTILPLAMLQGLLWASAFPMLEVAGQGLPAMTAVALRLTVAAIALVLWRWWRSGRLAGYPAGSFLAMLVLAVIGNTLPFSMLLVAQRSITSGEAALIIALVPSISMLAAPFFLADEPFTVSRFSGTFIGLVGVAVLVWPRVQEVGSAPLAAYALTLATAVCYGLTHVIAKYYHQYSSLDRAAGSMVVAALLAIGLMLLVDGWTPLPWQADTVLACIGLGLVPSALASLTFFYIVTHHGTVVTGFAGYTVPVFGVLLGAFFFGETLSLSMLVALVFILAGMKIARP